MKQSLIAILVIAALSIACGSSTSGTIQVTPAEAQSGVAGDKPTEAPAQLTTYNVGDTIELKDHRITLNAATVNSGILTANFTIENTGSKELNVSSLISFSAKDDDGGKLDQNIFDCETPLDGTVLSGDKSKGDICWAGLTTQTARIYYEPNLFGSVTIVWEVTP